MNMNQSKEAIDEARAAWDRTEEAHRESLCALSAAASAHRQAAEAEDVANKATQEARLRLDRLLPLEPSALRLLHLASKGTGYRYKHFSKRRSIYGTFFPTATHGDACRLNRLGFVDMECVGLFYSEPLITITEMGREKLAAEQASKPTKRPAKRAAR